MPKDWNAKPGLPQHLLPGWPDFLGCSDHWRKPEACQRGFINKPTGPSASPLKVQAVQAVNTSFKCADEFQGNGLYSCCRRTWSACCPCFRAGLLCITWWGHPCVYASHHGDTLLSVHCIMGTPLGWRDVRCSEDAEVGDFSNEDLLHPDLIWTSLLVYPPPGKYLPLKSNYLQVGGQKISMSFPY